MDVIEDIKGYKNINLIHYNKICTFTTVIFCFLIFVIIYLYVAKFDYTFYTKAIYVGSDDTIKILVEEKNISKITNNNMLSIDSKKYEYKVDNIDLKILDSIPIQQYAEIKLKINLNKKYKIENNSIDILIIYDTKTGFEIVKDIILGKEK